MNILGVSWLVYEAAMISSQDQNVQCTVEQIINDHMDKAISQILMNFSEVREAGFPEGEVIEVAET